MHYGINDPTTIVDNFIYDSPAYRVYKLYGVHNYMVINSAAISTRTEHNTEKNGTWRVHASNIEYLSQSGLSGLELVCLVVDA